MEAGGVLRPTIGLKPPRMGEPNAGEERRPCEEASRFRCSLKSSAVGVDGAERFAGDVPPDSKEIDETRLPWVVRGGGTVTVFG